MDKSFTHKLIIVDVDLGDTILDVKFKIQEKNKGIPFYQQSLVCGKNSL